MKNLDKMFIARYSKRFAELNTNVYISAKDDVGNFEVPVPTLGTGGGTAITGTPDAFNLNPPAVVKVEIKKMKGFKIIYRVAFPYSEMEIAANKPEYFNFLVDKILDKAIANYAATVGGPDKVRFGTTYCTYEVPGQEGTVFRELAGEYFELRLYGEWSSEEEV